MKTVDLLHKFLKFKSSLRIKPFQSGRMITGSRLCRIFKLSPQKLKQIDNQEGFAIFGPVFVKKTRGEDERFVKNYGFGVTFRYFWPPEYYKRYRMIRERPLRKGIRRIPRR